MCSINRTCFVLDIENSSQEFIPASLRLEEGSTMPWVHVFCREDQAEAIRQRYSALSRFLGVHADAGSLPQSADTQISFWLGQNASAHSNIFLVAGTDARYESLERLLKKKHPSISIKRIRGDQASILEFLPYCCRACNTVVDSTHQLEQHNWRKHTCNLCRVVVADLASHGLKCDVCGSSCCATKIAEHNRTHHDPCGCCNPPRYFADHWRRDEHEKESCPYDCPFCKFRCNREELCIAHINDEHKGKPAFICRAPGCGSRFGTEKGRTKHCRVNH